MKNSLIAVVAFFALFLFASGARAQNPVFDKGYPKTGNDAGTILVDANINLGKGLSTTGTVTVTTVPVGGGLQKQLAVMIKAGQTGAVDTGVITVTGLTSGQNYNVTVTIVATDGKNDYNFTTDPGQAKAK